MKVRRKSRAREPKLIPDELDDLTQQAADEVFTGFALPLQLLRQCMRGIAGQHFGIRLPTANATHKALVPYRAEASAAGGHGLCRQQRLHERAN